MVIGGIGGTALLATFLVSGMSGHSRSGHVAPTLRPLAVEPEYEGEPSLSPDGREVVYLWWKDNPGLFIKSTDGGPARRLTDPGTNRVDAYAKWSPKGDAIAFLRQDGQRPETRGLHLIGPDGGGLRRLADISGIGLCWTVDGQALGFVDRASSGEPHAIHVITLADGRRHRLTTPPVGIFGDLHCSFSPDGQSMAFTRSQSADEADVWLVPLAGGEPRRLTFDGDAHEGLDWTPDGQAIVFASRRRTRLSLWKVKISTDGREPPALVEGTEGGAVLPTFSRPAAGRSAKLAFESRVHHVGVWRWDARTGVSASRVISSVWRDDHPSLSPDGRRVAFTSNRSGSSELWVADADGSSPIQLSQYNGPEAISSRWSPDGRSLAFACEAGGNHDIFVMTADGKASRRITSELSEEGDPSWSVDGRFIYFRSDREGPPRIWKAPSDGGDAVPVTKGPGSQAFESPDGKLVYFVRGTDVPGVWAVPVGGGAEVEVVPGVREGNWAVSQGGILFLAPEQPELYSSQAIMLFGFATRTISPVVAVPADAGLTVPGFAASRDGRTVLWTQIDTQINDILLLDPWRN
jgi:Tol biopolymer transport system component